MVKYTQESIAKAIEEGSVSYLMKERRNMPYCLNCEEEMEMLDVGTIITGHRKKGIDCDTYECPGCKALIAVEKKEEVKDGKDFKI